MKYIDADLIKSTQSLYSDIDSCIDVLLKARIEHNQENEGKALFQMEGLMVATLQQLSCIIDSLQQEEMDLEEALNSLDDAYFDLDGIAVIGATYYLTVEDLKDIARHFYKLGKNSK